MNLSKKQREVIRAMYGGRCAYCGRELGDKWHADHVEPVERELKWLRDAQGRMSKLVPTGKLHHPERDRLDNLKPACVPCNIDKHASTLEGWRRRLEHLQESLRQNHSAYRHALRFGLITEQPSKVIFHFERCAQPAPRRRVIF